MAAATHTIVKKIPLGDKLMVVTLIADGSGAGGTEVSNTSLGLSRIEAAWLGDTGDAAHLALTITGSKITLSAGTNGGTTQLFVIGF